MAKKKVKSKKIKSVSAKPKPGDRVEVILVKEEYKGILLETPEGEDKNLILLKLDNGYNVGINRKKILDLKFLESAKDIKEEEVVLKKEKDKSNVAMIITGGTIAARLNPKKGGVDWLDTPESFFKFYPEIFEKVNISKVVVPFMKASEDMDFRDWKKIANETEKLLNDSNIKGIIITHGTDFLHYTSAALSFFLSGNGKLNKPVVLTYSQRSIDRASSDANLNLQCSSLVAGMSDIAEVVLVGHASTNDDFCYTMRGTKVKKMHTSKRDAFKPINEKPIAKVSKDFVEVLDSYNKRKDNKLKVKTDTNFEEKVALVKIYPGQDPKILDFYLKEKYKGLVLEASGLGHLPTSRARKNWIAKIKNLIDKGVVVCITSQCTNGKVDPFVYSNGREVLNTGAIYLKDILSETALVKLGWVLGHKNLAGDKNKVKEKMLENIAGEFNDRLED